MSKEKALEKAQISGEQQFSSNNWPHEDAPAKPPKPLTKEQVAAIVSQQPSVSPSVIVAAQFAVALAGGLLAYGLTQRGSAALSAVIGGLIAAVPSGLMAYGITRSALKGSVVGLLVWEMVKIMVSIALFALVAVKVKSLEWVPMLLTFVVALKMVWVALIRSKPKSVNTIDS